MSLPLSSFGPHLVESSPDLGLFSLSVAIVWLTFRYGVRIARSSLKGELDYRSMLKLFGLCLFGCIAALARFALIFYEWARASEIMGWEDRFPLYWFTQLGVYWIYVTAMVSSLGVVVGLICLYLGAIEKTKIGGWLIRLRWVIVLIAGTLVFGLGSYHGVVRPYMNKATLLQEFEGTIGIDAYRNPVEVRLYTVYHEKPYGWNRYSVWDEEEERERRRLEEESWAKVSENYRGFRFEKETELLDPEFLKIKLDELYFFSAGALSTRPTHYLIRFVGETSVLDIWLGDNEKADIFTNVLMSDVPDALSFSRPYLDVMERTVGGGLKYHAFGDHVLELWVKRIKRLED